MFMYASQFDKDQIPHINSNNQIVDKIHNYRLPEAKKVKGFSATGGPQGSQAGGGHNEYKDSGFAFDDGP